MLEWQLNVMHRIFAVQHDDGDGESRLGASHQPDRGRSGGFGHFGAGSGASSGIAAGAAQRAGRYFVAASGRGCVNVSSAISVQL